MIINYSRTSQVEDPIERIRKERKKKEDGNFGIFRQSLAALGHSFVGNKSRDKIIEEEPAKNASFNSDKPKKEVKKGHRSNGIIGTLFRPLEIRPEDRTTPEKSTFAQKPPTGKKTPKASKDTDHADLEPSDNFFDQHLDMGENMRHRGTIAVTSPSSLEMSNLSSLEILSFYEDKPKDLKALFRKIGSNLGKSKNTKSWVASLIDKY